MSKEWLTAREATVRHPNLDHKHGRPIIIASVILFQVQYGASSKTIEGSRKVNYPRESEEEERENPLESFRFYFGTDSISHGFYLPACFTVATRDKNSLPRRRCCSFLDSPPRLLSVSFSSPTVHGHPRVSVCRVREPEALELALLSNQTECGLTDPSDYPVSDVSTPPPPFYWAR